MAKKNIIYAMVVFILLMLYLPFDQSFGGQVGSFKSAVDDWIPLLTIFTIPYISYYFFLLFSLLFFFWFKNDHVTEMTLLSLIITISAAYIFYYFFQNSVERPLIVESNFFDSTYTFINQNVPPYNAFPSLHVAISTVILMGYFYAKTKFFRYALIWVLLIIISTVLTKQHYFLDIPGGIVLAFMSYFLTKRFLVK